MKASKDLVALIGRVLLAVMFVYSGYGKLGSFQGTAGFIASKGLPLPEIATTVALVVELIGGLMVAAGWKTRWAAAAIVVFTAVATYYFHDFWHMADEAAMTNQIMFLKNLAVIGGMLLLIAFGPGRYSVDRTELR